MLFLPVTLSFETTNYLSTVVIKLETTSRIIKTFDQNKDCGHNNNSVRMLKICGSSIIKPLCLLFNNCVRQGVFFVTWKMTNVLLLHKENRKQLVDNYQLVSLLSICSKMFEKLLFDSICKFLDKNCLLNSYQTWFRPNDSNLHQLIAITHDTFTHFDANPSLVVFGAFLDLSKAFNRVA